MSSGESRLRPLALDPNTPLSRRTVLRGMGAAAGAVMIPGALAACGSDSSSSSGSGSSGGTKSASGTVTIGSNASDELPKQAYVKVFGNFEQQNSGLKTKVNTVDHNTFQEQINSYLQGKPDDVFMWFAGYRMQFFASKGLTTDINDVWQDIGSNYSDALKKQSTGLDGKQYFIPFYYYPWAVFYRPSVFKKNGYEVPKTLDELTALSKQMQKDGLDPIAFADKDGWPAMGTFDILNMRHNGYDFHISLMKGEASWEDPKVKQVFDTWRGLLPYHQGGALGRTWQEAAKSLSDKKTGMYLLGMFVGQQFSDTDREDLDFFAFPEIDSTIGADTLDAPIDGFLLSKKPKNEDGAKALMKYLASGAAQDIYLKTDPNNIACAKDADTSGYSKLQQKAVELVSNASNISQFMDRDTRPDFASTVMIPALQTFIRKPDDIDGLTKSIEQQKKTIFTA
jgi:multiple sugar transport system substrate-binding protein